MATNGTDATTAGTTTEETVEQTVKIYVAHDEMGDFNGAAMKGMATIRGAFGIRLISATPEAVERSTKGTFLVTYHVELMVTVRRQR
jgi:hypothetical protein